MGVIAAELEILILIIEDRAYRRVKVHSRELAGLARQLLIGLLEVVAVEVRIAQGV